MKFTVEEVSPVERKLTVEVPGEDMEAVRQQVLQKIKRSAKLNGFRPGKAPTAMVENYYASQINIETMEKLLDKYYPEAVAESGLTPLNRPKFDISSISGDFIFSALFEITPSFELDSSSYLGLELQDPSLAPDEAAVDNTIEHIRSHQARLVAVEETRPAGGEDVVIADYQMFDVESGEPMEDKIYNAELELGRDLLLEPIKTVLTGAETGQRLETVVDFGQEVQNPNLRGKKARFVLEVKGLKKRELPELNLDFVKQMWPEMESVEQFREKVAADLRERFQQQNDQNLRRQLIEKISALADFEIPPSLIQAEEENMLTKFKSYMKNEGVDSLPGFDDASLREELKGSAAKKVKAGIILSRIAQMENIEVKDEDLEDEFARLANGRSIDEVRNYFINNNMLSVVGGRIIENKTLRRLRDAAKIIKPENEDSKLI
ncbi:MAG: trigger factor [Desulfarculales bacterium]|jgi:trigger factor|nr:trigger factor [Desulfarculales bacterium]